MVTASARSTRSESLSGNARGTGRTRSFGGCYTCRKRHVKCDERQPACRQCDRAGVACGGYSKKLIFDSDVRGDGGDVDDESARFRRPLLTEDERRYMSKLLVSAVPPGATARVLQRLDEDVEAMYVEGSREMQVTRGPFGAFMAKSQDDEAPLGTDSTQQDSISDPPLGQQSGNLICCDPTLLHPAEEAELNEDQDSWELLSWLQCTVSLTTDQEDAANFQTPHLEGNENDHGASHHIGFLDESPPKTIFVTAGSSYDHEAHADNQLAAPGPSASVPPIPEYHLDSDFQAKGLESDTEVLPLTQHDLNAGAIGFPTMMPSFMNMQQNPILVQAIPLLKHYGTTVVACMSPFRHRNTPWHIMFLAQLKTCLATLTLRESLDEIGLTTFYGSLAVSALSLGMTSRSPMWLGHVSLYQQQACTHARTMLMKPCSNMDAEKYRSVLIALLTMAQMSTYLGRRDQTEGFLLEAERLVRVRGFARKKSRKIRLLHHCYVYMRLLHESTFVAPAGHESYHRRQVRLAVESSGVANFSDNLSFRLLQWQDLLREMTVIKGQIEGENDLHIAKPGLFPATMYPEIFGIPETFLFLLSQTIRLGNEKDLAGQSHEAEPISLGDFTRRGQAIERGIDQLRGEYLTAEQSDSLVLPTILDGMQCALSIYFYRRIYNVSSSMLQAKVVAVRDWLFTYNQTNPEVLHGSFGLVWPAFVAACEADGVDLQDSFRHWFRTAAQRGGPVCTAENSSLSFVERVWQARAGENKTHVNWLDLIREGSAPDTRQTIFMDI